MVGGFLFVCYLCFSFQTRRGLSKFWISDGSLPFKSDCNNTNAVSEFPNNASHLLRKKNLIHIHFPFVVFLRSRYQNVKFLLSVKNGLRKSQRVISHHVFKGETNQSVYKAMSHDD